MNNNRSILERVFIPRYDELVLFLMSCAFIVLFISHDELRVGAFSIVSDNRDFPELLVVILFLLGIAFSLYHVFTSRGKTNSEKTFMLFSAVIISCFSGLAAGMHLLEESRGLLVLFPIWNIVNGFLLFIMYQFDILDESDIVDDNASALEVIAGLVVVLLTFGIGTFVFDLYWAIVFSMCVAYATNFNAFVKDYVSATVR